MNEFRKSILLCVDDEEIVLLCLKEQLRNAYGQNFIYEMALSAEEALEIISETEDADNTIVIIISDWLMPGMKGDEFMIYLENHFPNIKKILLTGQADPNSLHRAKTLGHVDHVIAKPWTKEQLVSAIGDLHIIPSN